MPKLRTLMAALSSTVFLQQCSTAENWQSNEAFLRLAETYLDTCVESTRTPGAGLLVFQTGEETAFFSAGFEDLEKERVFSPDTRFTVHSISKMVAGIIVMQLVDEGALSLDVPISTYVPELQFENDYQDVVTLRQLLSHTSGLPFENENLATSGANALDAPNMRFVFEPGAPGKRAYSNTAFAIVGAIIEAVERQDLDEIVAKRVTGPIGMANTWLGSDPYDESLASQYMPVRYDLTYNLDTPMQKLPRPRFEHLGAGLTSSMNDLAKLGRVFLMQGQAEEAAILDANSFAKFTTSVAPGEEYDQALGVRRYKIAGGREVLGHSGDWAGGRTALFVAPELGFGIVAAANTVRRCDVADIGYRLFEAAYDMRDGGEPAPDYDAGDRKVSFIQTIPNADDYVGLWQDRSGETIEFAINEGRLSASIGARQSQLERYLDYDGEAFVRSGEDPGRYPMEFSRKANGEVDQLFIGPDLYLKPDADFPSQQQIPQEWTKVIGSYRNDKAAPHGFEIYAREGELYRRSFWAGGEVQLIKQPSSDGRTLSFTSEEGALDLTFDVLGNRVVRAWINGAPFEKSYLDIRRLGSSEQER